MCLYQVDMLDPSLFKMQGTQVCHSTLPNTLFLTDSCQTHKGLATQLEEINTINIKVCGIFRYQHFGTAPFLLRILDFH